MTPIDKSHPIQKADLLRDLRALGLQEGAVVLVHSSMSKIGYVEGGAPTVIAALREAVGAEGTLVFPAHTGYETCSPESPPVFDARLTPSLGMGAIAETARTMAGAVRSLSPTHSVTALGPKAQWLCERHHLSPTPCGDESPYDRLAQAGGFILLLGVDHENNTCLHMLEEEADVDYHMLPGSATMQIVDLEGKERTIVARFHRWGGAEREFNHVEPVLLEHGAERIGKVGNATARLIDAAAMRTLILIEMARNGKFLVLGKGEGKAS